MTTRPWWATHAHTPTLTPSDVIDRRTRLPGLITTALTLTLAALVLHGTTPSNTSRYPDGMLAHRQTTTALTAGCGPTFTAPGREKAHAIKPARKPDGTPNRLTYPNIVPINGDSWPQPAPSDQTYWKPDEPRTPQPENLLNNMWTGATVIYYTDHIPPNEQQTLLHLAETTPDVIVVPWPKDRPPFPGGRHLAIAAWNWSQTCHRVNADVINEFRTAHPASSAPGHRPTRTR